MTHLRLHETPNLGVHQTGSSSDAVSLFERYAKGGDNPKLKDWAGKTLPTLQHHLEMAQNLDKKK
jgi:putative membrane protein